MAKKAKIYLDRISKFQPQWAHSMYIKFRKLTFEVETTSGGGSGGGGGSSLLCNSVAYALFQSVALVVVQTYTMAIRVVEFSNGGYKIRKIFAKESTYSKEIIEF